MRVEVKTSEGYIIIEDHDKDTVRVYFAKGEEVALVREKGELRSLGIADRSELRRLGRSV